MDLVAEYLAFGGVTGSHRLAAGMKLLHVSNLHTVFKDSMHSVRVRMQRQKSH